MRRAVQSLIFHSLMASVLMMGPYVGVTGPPSTDGTCSVTCLICNTDNGQKLLVYFLFKKKNGRSLSRHKL